MNDKSILKYSTAKFLGKGAYGEVHLANTDSPRKFAVKKGLEIHNEKSMLKRLNEKKSQLHQRHLRIDPNYEIAVLGANCIPEYMGREIMKNPFTFGLTKKITALQMEYIEGTTLENIMGLRNEEGMSIVMQYLSGLKFMHSMARIAHSDIKEANTMITKHKNGLEVKIIDFGLSKKLEQDTQKNDMRQLTNLLFSISISTKGKEATPKFWELINSYGQFQTVDGYFNAFKKDIEVKQELQTTANKDSRLASIVDCLYSHDLKKEFEKK